MHWNKIKSDKSYLPLAILLVSIIIIWEGINFIYPSLCHKSLCFNTVEYVKPKITGYSKYRKVKGIRGVGKITYIPREEGKAFKILICDQHLKLKAERNLLYHIKRLYSFFIYYLLIVFTFPVVVFEKIINGWWVFGRFLRYYYSFFWMLLAVNYLILLLQRILKKDGLNGKVFNFFLKSRYKNLNHIGKYIFFCGNYSLLKPVWAIALHPLVYIVLFSRTNPLTALFLFMLIGVS